MLPCHSSLSQNAPVCQKQMCLKLSTCSSCSTIIASYGWGRHLFVTVSVPFPGAQNWKGTESGLGWLLGWGIFIEEGVIFVICKSIWNLWSILVSSYVICKHCKLWHWAILIIVAPRMSKNYLLASSLYLFFIFFYERIMPGSSSLRLAIYILFFGHIITMIIILIIMIITVFIIIVTIIKSSSSYLDHHHWE